MILFLVQMLVLGLVINWPGVMLSAIVLVLFLVARVSVAKAMAYSCFALIGGTVARFQWLLLVEEDADTIGWYQIATVSLVGTLCVIALATSASRLKEERPLQIMFLLTMVLAVLQFGGVPHVLLNWYARIYALVCIAITLVVVARDWRARKGWRRT